MLPGHNLQAVDNEAEQAGEDLATELMGEYLGGDTWTQMMLWQVGLPMNDSHAYVYIYIYYVYLYIYNM